MIPQILAAVVGRGKGVVVGFTGTTTVANGPGGTFAQLEIRADGTVWRVADGTPGTGQIGSWIEPDSASTLENYQLKFTQVSGTAPEVGILDAELDLSSNRGIGYSAPSTGESGVFTAEIILGGITLASEDYTITN